MLRFKKLEIKNFLSYGNSPTTINLDDVGTTLIVGEDLDNTASGVGANGVGKTVWLNALIYGLFGKPISNISMDNLVNNINKKDMYVLVEFQKDDLIITVKRARKEKGAGNYAKVFVRPIGTDLNENEHDKTPDSVSNINDFIVNYLGIPYELFVRIVAFAATHAPFLDLPLRQQSDMMEELFRLTRLSFKAEKLKTSIKDTKQELELVIKRNEQLEKEHERHNKQLDSALSRVNDWEKERNDNLSLAKNKLSEYKKIPVDEQENLYKQLDELNKVLAQEKEEQNKVESVIKDISAKMAVALAELKVIDENRKKVIEWKDLQFEKITKAKKFGEGLVKTYILSEQKKLIQELDSITEALKELEDEKQTIIADYTENESVLKTAEKELEHLLDAKCPYCLQDFEGAKQKAKECKTQIENSKQKEIDYSRLLDAIESNIKIKKENETDVYNKINYTLEEISEQERLRIDTAKTIEDLLKEKNPYTEATASDLSNIKMEIEKEVETFKKELDKEADSLLLVDKTISELKNKIAACNENISIPSLAEVFEIKNKIIQHETKIKELEEEENPYIEPLEELKAITLDPIDIDRVNNLDNLLTHKNYMLKLLTKKDSFIRKTLLSKNLAFLNSRLQYYLSALYLPHRVEFTQEMTAKITQFGRELDFGNLSSGQKARVNLALSFAFRDVLQKSHETINVCILDEVLDVGLDAVGVQNAARMLKRKARDEELSLFIISHRDEVSNIFDKIMTVQMNKGFSTIKVEE